MRQRGVVSVSVAVGVIAVGCGDSTAPQPCVRPVIRESAVGPNPANVLSAIVAAEVEASNTVAVSFGPTGKTREITPAQSTSSLAATLTLPVLALRPSTTYELQVVASNGCGTVAGNPLLLTTGELPSDLPSFSAGGPDPSPGYVVFASGSYALAIDNGGRVVWYHRFPNGAGLNLQPQPNGRYAVRPNPPAGSPPRSLELDALGNVVRELSCARGLQARLHDILAQPDGSYWLLCDEVRSMDLSAQGGAADARVLGTVVQQVGISGELLFEWSPFDHLDIDLSELDPSDVSGPNVNWTHGNAIDLDIDGNLLLSLRNLSQVVKIDTRTGAVLWRMGGRSNAFRFVSGDDPPFARQHGVRAVGRDALLVLDNLGSPASRAERYEFREADSTARLNGSYTSSAGVTAFLGGSVQELPGGRVLVAFGNGGAVEEFNASGAVTWRINGNPGYVFRAQRVASLYSPGSAERR